MTESFMAKSEVFKLQTSALCLDMAVASVLVTRIVGWLKAWRKLVIAANFLSDIRENVANYSVDALLPIIRKIGFLPRCGFDNADL